MQHVKNNSGGNVATLGTKQEAILTAAFEVFSKYGYRRTSMEDIGTAAGMSRAALYLHYRNKEDIFRSLVAMYYAQTQQACAATLAIAETPAKGVMRTFMAQAEQVAELLLGAPHGEELMDAKTGRVQDIVAEGEAKMASIYADWLLRQAAAGQVDLSGFAGDAHGVAATMIAALHGQKTDRPTPEIYLARVKRLAELFGQALSK